MGTEKPKADLLPGTLDMLVLKTLTRGQLHGYAIAQRIRQLSDDLLRVEAGSLYPALQRLELNGWIEGEWGLSARCSAWNMALLPFITAMERLHPIIGPKIDS